MMDSLESMVKLFRGFLAWCANIGAEGFLGTLFSGVTLGFRFVKEILKMFYNGRGQGLWSHELQRA